MAKVVTVTLTAAQVDALLSAIGEVTAGPTDLWSAASLRALLNAKDKLLKRSA